MSEINIYLDDLRDSPEGFILARTVEEAIHLLRNNKVNILSLGENPKTKELLPTGYDLVKYMCEHGIVPKKIYMHTDNVVGRENMYQTLLAARRRGFIDKDTEIYHYPITVNRYSGD